MDGDKEGEIRREEFFLVLEDISDTSLLHKEINEFVVQHVDKHLGRFIDYQMLFYKEDYEITLENINKNPDLILKQQWADANPLMCIYRWLDGKFVTIKYFKNGALVEHKEPK
jgi:hypothetical protein